MKTIAAEKLSRRGKAAVTHFRVTVAKLEPGARPKTRSVSIRPDTQEEAAVGAGDLLERIRGVLTGDGV